MDGLKTTRVLVVDDKIKEAQPFMAALAKRGIGTIFFSGDVDDLPPDESKLTGIRLAALDLDLLGGGEAPTVIGHLLNVVNSVIDTQNGPYLAIAWTSKDDTYFDELQSRISELSCQPIDFIKMSKGDYESSDAIDRIFQRVEQSVDGAYPLGLLCFWEQTIHDSSGSVMQILPNSSDWASDSRKTLNLIIENSSAEGDSAEAKLASILSTFNSLQLDSVESNLAQLEDAARFVSPLIGEEPPEDTELKAKLNFRLLRTDAAEGHAPGNVYHCDGIFSGEDSVFPDLDKLLDDFVRGRPKAEPRARQQQLQAEDCKISTLKAANCVPIAMEVTPLCDFQQGNTRLLRFLCGLALPFGERRKGKKPEGFLRTDYAPIEFRDGELAGRKLLVWNSRFVVSAREDQINDDSKLFRLRQSHLIDVQGWLTSQLNRPGVFTIRARW